MSGIRAVPHKVKLFLQKDGGKLAGRESFISYTKHGKQFELLTDEEAGKLVKAIYKYKETGEDSALPVAASMAFSFIRAQLDEDNEKYEQTCIKRSGAGKQGGRPTKAKKANALFEKQTELPSPGEGYCDCEGDSDRDTAAATARASDLRKLCQFYENNNFGAMARSHYDEIGAHLDEGASALLIERCMKEAVDNGSATWAYARKVLLRCQKQGICTAEQFEAEKRKKEAERAEKPKKSSNPFAGLEI